MLLQKLKSTLKLLFSDIRQAIVAVIVIALLGSIGGLLYLSKTALYFSIAILNTLIPLWATIALVLLVGVYIYQKKSRNQSYSKVVLYAVNNLKWKVSINNVGSYRVSKTPYCKKHELKLIQSTNCVAWKCPKLSECYTKINNSNIRNLRQKALSHIERAVRDKKIKC